MKPITNLLLVLALVCYTFMAFYEFSFMGSISGLDFTAGKIQLANSALSVMYGLTPYLTLFLAIGLNSLRNRYWGVAVTLLIVLCLYFFNHAAGMNGAPLMPLEHDPSAAGDSTLGQGYIVLGLGKGFWASATLTALALISVLVSMMPLEFNLELERSIDERIKHSKHRIGRMARHENEQQNIAATATGNEQEQPVDTASTNAISHEGYMPEQQPQEQNEHFSKQEEENSESTDHAAYMPR